MVSRVVDGGLPGLGFWLMFWSLVFGVAGLLGSARWRRWMCLFMVFMMLVRFRNSVVTADWSLLGLSLVLVTSQLEGVQVPT